MKFNSIVKKSCLLLITLTLFSTINFAQVSGNPQGKPDTVSGSVSSSGKSSAYARMNTRQRDEIISPATGMLIYNTDCHAIQQYNGSNWSPLENAGRVPSLGLITGNRTPCMNSTGEKYSVSSLPEATSYTWKVPQGSRIVKGQGTTSIVVDFGTTGGAVYVSASGPCWTSAGSYLGITLLAAPQTPAQGNHYATQNQITWNWNNVPGAQGYKFNTVNDFNNATDMGVTTSTTEKGLTSNTNYTRYVWAYFPCGRSEALAMLKSTLPPGSPNIATVAVENITSSAASVTGNVMSDGGAPLTARGICWSVNPNPTLSNSKVTAGTKTGIFTKELKNLAPNTTYFVRTYATNSQGTMYGNELIFKTACAEFLPVSVSISTASNNVCPGTPVTFTATPVNGGTNPVYQWKVNGTFVTGATGSTYTFTPTSNNVVICMMSSNAECVSGNPAQSNTVTLSVKTIQNASVTITSSSSQLCEGSSVTLTAQILNGGSAPTYQWKVNGNDLSGATGTMYTYIPMHNDVITCAMTPNTECANGVSVVSNPLNMTVNPILPLGVTITPSANPFAPGSQVTLTAVVTNGGDDLSYQWMNNGVNTGTNSNTLSYMPVSGDNLICVVTSGSRCVAGNPAFSPSLTMMVDASYPAVATAAVKFQPQSKAVTGGEVVAQGNSAVTARGVCWSTSPNPVTTGSFTSNGNGMGAFESTLSDLAPNTQYYIRAYAVNASGTAYGQEMVVVTLPVTTTLAVEGITQSGARSGGNVMPGGGAYIASRGVCWSTKPNPTILDNHTMDGTGTGVFSSNLTGLKGNTLYYVRAYAKNLSGIAYGNQQTFSTLPVTPALATNPATDISLTSARSGGRITSNGGSKITSYGICWSTSPSPTIEGYHTTNENTSDVFMNEITNLQPNTTYYVRSYAVNSEGTAYGNEIPFTTLLHPSLPTVKTNPLSNFSGNTAGSGGVVLSDGGSPVTSFGLCWGTSPNPTLANNYTIDGSGSGPFVSMINNLTPAVHYYFRAYAVNGVGVSYGEEMEINKYQIGQQFGGGIIFYVDGTGKHGLIAAPADQSNSATWGCYGTPVNGTYTGTGTGAANTQAVVGNCPANDIAARLCHNLVMNGFEDWYLPSRDELNLMYQLKGVIGGFSNDNYWSSSEFDSNFTWYQSFYDGYQYKYDKYLTGSVRAIRSF